MCDRSNITYQQCQCYMNNHRICDMSWSFPPGCWDFAAGRCYGDEQTGSYRWHALALGIRCQWDEQMRPSLEGACVPSLVSFRKSSRAIWGRKSNSYAVVRSLEDGATTVRIPGFLMFICYYSDSFLNILIGFMDSTSSTILSGRPSPLSPHTGHHITLSNTNWTLLPLPGSASCAALIQERKVWGYPVGSKIFCTWCIRDVRKSGQS